MSQALLRFLVLPCRFNLAWVPAVLCLCGFWASCYFFKDAAYYFDPINQLFHAKIGIIGDWHPPIMSATLHFISFATLSLCFTGLLWSGFFLCIRFPKFWNSPKPVWLILCIMFLLLWLSLDLYRISGYFGKDLGFIGSYLFAVGLLLGMPKRFLPKMIIGTITLLCLYYGTSLRHNALPALLPLLCWFIWCFVPNNRINSFYRLLTIVCCATLLWVGYIALNHYVNYSVIKAVKLYSMSEIFYNDIWHLNAITDNYIVPPQGFGNNFTVLDEKEFREKFDSDQLFWVHCFTKINASLPRHNRLQMDRSGIILYKENEHGPIKIKESIMEPLRISALRNEVNIDYMYFIPLSDTNNYPADYRVLQKVWTQRLMLDPFAYLKFKARFYLRLFRDHDIWFLRLNGLSVLPFTILMALIGFLSPNRMSKEVFPAWLLSLSALFYVLPLFFFMPAEQHRYLYWFYAASFISIAYFLAHSPLFAAILRTVQQYLERKVQKDADGVL